MTNENALRYLDMKLKEVKRDVSYDEGRSKDFQLFYDSSLPIQLQELFSVFHYRLNGYFRFMNSKISYNRHYNADQSRELIELLELISEIKNALSKSELNFFITSPYAEVIEACLSFLETSNGSSIPDDFSKITIIEYEAVFILQNSVSITGIANSALPLKMIGGGSYANVFKYKDNYYNRYFVIKKAKKDLSNEELLRFRNEYTIMSSLKSPYIVEVYNYNEIKNEYTMEYVDYTLEKYINKNNDRLSISQRLNILSQIMKAFVYISKKGILHRDISFQNILLKQYDELMVIKVADFGLVKTPNSHLTRHSTEIKGALNDPSLISEGFDKYNEKHEIYALARVINFVLTGKTNGINNFNNQMGEFISKAMSPDAKNRHESIEDMNKEFNRVKKSLLL